MTRTQVTFALLGTVAIAAAVGAAVSSSKARATPKRDDRSSAAPMATAPPATSASAQQEPAPEAPASRVAWSEPHGDRTPLDAVVRFGFDGPVDHAAVEASFVIDPVVDGDLSWEDDTLTFRPKKLAPVTSYKAEVKLGHGDAADVAHAAFRTMFPPPGAITPGEDGHAIFTFDDGPRTSSQATRLIDWLARNDVKAILFPSGRWAKDHEDLLTKAREQGHLVCNHGMTHVNLTLFPDAKVEEEILGGAGHGTCHLLRPPLMGYSQRIEAIATRLGYRSFLWDVDTRDWEGLPAEDIENLVLSRIFPGAVVLFHMHAAHTEEALPKIAKKLRDAGYKLSYPLTKEGALDLEKLGPGSSRPPEELTGPPRAMERGKHSR